MADTPASSTRSRKIYKWFFRIALLILTLVGLFAGIILFLPRLVSTEAGRNFIEHQVSSFLNRSIHIEHVSWRWLDGITVQGVAIEDQTRFSKEPLIYFEEFQLDFLNIKSLLNRRFAVSASLEGLKARMIRDKDGVTNIQVLLDEIKKKKEPPEKPELKDKPIDWRNLTFKLPLDFDVETHIHFAPMSFYVEDRLQNRVIFTNNTSLLLDAPSLKSKPVALSFTTGLQVDSQTFEPQPHLHLTIENLFDEQSALKLSQTLINLNSLLPGIVMNAEGGLSGIHSKTQIDLKQLMDVVNPFLSQPLSQTKVNGSLEIGFQITGDPEKTLDIEAVIKGKEINLERGIVKDKKVGPVHFEIQNHGIADIAAETLSIEQGIVKLLGNNNINWNARVSQFKAPEPEVILHIESILVDLKEVYALARPFAPKRLSLDFGNTLSRPVLTVNNVQFLGKLPKVTGPAEIKSAELNLPFLEFTFGLTGLSARKLSVELTGLNTELEDFMPTRFQSTTGVMCKYLELKGPQALEIDELSMPEINMVINSFQKPEMIPSDLNIRTSFKVNRFQMQDITLKGLELPLVEINLKDIIKDGLPGSLGVKTSLGLDLVKMPALSVQDMSMPSVEIEAQNKKTNGLLDAARLKTGLKIKQVNIPESLVLDVVNIPSIDIVVGHIPKNGLPESVNVRTALELKGLDMQGDQPVRLNSAAIRSLNLKVSDIQKGSKALFGVSANVSLEESLTLGKLSVPPFAQAGRVRQNLSAEISLPKTGKTSVSIKGFELNTPYLQITNKTTGTVKTALSLNAAVPSLQITDLKPFNADINGFRAQLKAGDFLSTRIQAEAKNLAFEHLSSTGQLKADLGKLTSLLPPRLMKGVKTNGAVQCSWDFSGVRPTAKNIENLMSSSTDSSVMLDNTRFLQDLRLLVALTDIDLNVPLDAGSRLNVTNINTKKALELTLNQGLQRADLGGTIEIASVREIPSLGKLLKPLKLFLNFNVKEEKLQSLSLSQSLNIEPFEVREELSFNLYGLNKLLNKGINTPVPLWLRYLGGTFTGRILVAKAANLPLTKGDVVLKGKLDAGASGTLSPGQSVSMKTWLNTSGMNISVGKQAEIDNLQAHFDLEKKYDIVRLGRKTSTKSSDRSHLSKNVLTPRKQFLSSYQTGSAMKRRIIEDVKGRLTGPRSLSFDSASIYVEPVPFRLRNCAMDFNLVRGLPTMEFFQIDLIGGTLMGSFALERRGEAFAVRLLTAFTGLNAKKLLPDIIHGIPDREAEISGQMAVTLPLSTSLDAMLEAIDLEIEITHIGSRALERALYAIDPYENNEAIVKQRKYLKLGTPKWIKVGVKYGNLSISGQVQAKGITLDLPEIGRFNVANIPGIKGIDRTLEQLEPLFGVLHKISSDAIAISNRGEIEFQ